MSASHPRAGSSVRPTLEVLEDRAVPATVFAVTSGNVLLEFDSATPGTITRAVPLSGLPSGQRILGIDFRPATGQLYALDSTLRVSVINTLNGALTSGQPGSFPGNTGTFFGFDVNPTTDQIRVTNDTAQNLRLNPNNGTLVGTDTPLAYAANDIAVGVPPHVVASAYTNNFAGGTSPVLFGIDSNLDTLVIQNPENNGTLTTVGILGVNTTDNVAFDIQTINGVNIGYATLTPPGANTSALYIIDLSTGAASLVNPVGGSNQVVAMSVAFSRNETPGVFDPSTGLWFLRNLASSGPPSISPFAYGGLGWTPVVGDWNGDSRDTVGVVEPNNPGTGDLVWYLRNSNSSGNPDFTPFAFGAKGWIPVVGDWDGNGTDTVGVFDPGTSTWYLRNTNSSGPADAIFQYGGLGWLPVVGDWDGDGTTTVGVADPTGTTNATDLVWYLRNSNSSGAPDLTPFNYGTRNWIPVVGDWNGDGRTTVGVVEPNNPLTADLVWHLRNFNAPGPVNFIPFSYGSRAWRPIVGDWVFPSPQF